VTASRLPQAAARSIPVLLGVLLVAVTVSITAIDVLIALLVAATLVALTDPALRARYRLPLGRPLLAFVALTLVSAALATDRAVAFFESKHLIALALFPIAVNGFESGDAVRRALRWFFAAVGVVSLYAILQTLACDTALALPGWVGAALRVRLEACRAVYPFRAKGFFSIYMTFGGSLMIALSLELALLTLGQWPRRLRLVVPGALAVLAFALTYVRGAWLGLAAAIGLLVVWSRRLWLVVPVLLSVLLALAVPSTFRTRMLSLGNPGDETMRDRLDFWDAGRRMIADAPLLGLGPGGVRRAYPVYKPPGARKLHTGHLHNNLIQIGAEHGLLGLAAWLWIWTAFFAGAGRISAALPAARADDRALVAGSVAAVTAFLVAGLFEYNFGDSEVIDLLWLVMAFPFVCAGGARRPATATPDRL
jgi:O-antigen ligase